MTTRCPSLLSAAAIALCAGSAALAQAPDAAISDMQVPQRGAVSSPVGSASYSIGATTCNLGGAPLPVVATPGNHPVYVQNIYRLANGRFQQIRMSWAFHEVCALQAQCSSCNPFGNWSALGAGSATSDTSSI